MTHSPTPTELAALKVANASLMSADSAYDFASTIVFALGSAQLLQSPETAAELTRLRGQVASLGNEIYDIRLRRDDARAGREEAERETERLRARVVELEAERAPKPCGRELSTGQPCPDHPRTGAQRLDARAAQEAEATHWRRLGVTAPVEDPHDSPLHHEYKTPHDLEFPEVTP